MSSQSRGKLFENLIKHYIQKHGYVGITGTKRKLYNISGSHVKGRGGKHQIDALGQFEFSIPFVYPIRLLSEAKCYSRKAIGIDIVRNFVGVVKDISENYSVEQTPDIESRFRFTDCACIFSTTEFTRDAQDYAYAQGVYLVLMKGLHPLIKLLSEQTRQERLDNDFLKPTEDGYDSYVELEGKRYYGYFGLAENLYPIFIMSNKKFPLNLFNESDIQRVNINYKFGANEENNLAVDDQTRARKRVDYFTVSFNGWEGQFSLPSRMLEKYVGKEEYREAMKDMKRKLLKRIIIPIAKPNIKRILVLEMGNVI